MFQVMGASHSLQASPRQIGDGHCQGPAWLQDIITRDQAWWLVPGASEGRRQARSYMFAKRIFADIMCLAPFKEMLLGRFPVQRTASIMDCRDFVGSVEWQSTGTVHMHCQLFVDFAFHVAMSSNSVGGEGDVFNNLPVLLSSDSDASTSASVSSLSSIEISDSDEGGEVSLAAQ